MKNPTPTRDGTYENSTPRGQGKQQNNQHNQDIENMDNQHQTGHGTYEQNSTNKT